MKLVYPARFYKEKEGGYSVEVPDLRGCITQADTLEEAIEMAEDAALGWILTAIEDDEELPVASKIEDIGLQNKNEFVSLLLLDIDKYTEKYGNRKSVKKTLTIPTWLNHRAEKIGVNFSKTLQEALLNKIIKYQRK